MTRRPHFSNHDCPIIKVLVLEKMPIIAYFYKLNSRIANLYATIIVINYKDMLLRVIEARSMAILLKMQSYAFALAKDQLIKDKINLSPSAQKALWASKYISFIKNAEPRKEITDKSLREQLLAIQEPTPLYQFDKQITQEMRSYFQEGVDLDYKTFGQTRIQYGRQVETGVKSKFIFCPSVTITKPIFKFLTQTQINFLITGGFGIGKTASIILFVLLSNNVNRYIYQAITTKFYQRQFERLRKSGFLCENIPRYWYWSVDRDKAGIYKAFQKMVLNQTHQLPQNVKSQLLKRVEPFRFVRDFDAIYPSDIKRGVIVDQINAIASLMRQYNSKTYKSTQSLEQSTFKSQYMMRLMNSAGLLRNTLLDFIQLGNFYALNSSTSIEYELLQTNNENSSKLSLNLEGHSVLEKKRIQYKEQLEKKEGMIDFWQTFWFQFERNLPKRVSAQNAKKMQQLFYEEVKDEKVNYFSRFLFIREYLADNHMVQKYVRSFEDYENNTAVGEKKNPFFKIAQDFAAASLKRYREKFKRFFEKGIDSSQRLAIILVIFEYALKETCKKQPKRSLLRMTFQQLAESLKIPDIESVIQMEEYKEIIPIQLIDNDKGFEFYWEAQFFVKAVYPVLYQPLNNFAFTPHQIQGFNNYSILRGVMFQHSLIKSLTQGSVMKIYPDDYKPIDFVFKIGKRSQFTPFNPKYRISLPQDDNSIDDNVVQLQNCYNFKRFQTNLNEVFDLCKLNQEQFVLATPCYQGKYADKSICIDFVIMKLSKGQFQLYSFDVTTSGQLSKKISQAKSFFKKLFQEDKSKLPLNVKHIILCPEESCVKIKLNTEKPYNIMCASWKKLTIQKSENYQAFNTFKQIRQVLELIKEKK